jgi:PST family polysaccharide transporter
MFWLLLLTCHNQKRNYFLNFYKGYYPFLFWEWLSFILLFFFLSLNYFYAGILPVTTLFFWQLVGCFKSGLIDFRLSVFAKNLQWLYCHWITISFDHLLIKYIFSLNLWSRGIVMAHALTYFVYLLVLVVYFRKVYFSFRPSCYVPFSDLYIIMLLLYKCSGTFTNCNNFIGVLN